jgi:hypothetical protein
VCNKLNSIQNLHGCIDDNLIQFPIEQQALAQECNEKCDDDMLESRNISWNIGYICSKTKDCLLLSKENMNELQSIIRRKRGI